MFESGKKSESERKELSNGMFYTKLAKDVVLKRVEYLLETETGKYIGRLFVAEDGTVTDGDIKATELFADSKKLILEIIESEKRFTNSPNLGAFLKTGISNRVD